MSTDGSEERFDLTIIWRIENISRLEIEEIEGKWWNPVSPTFRSHSLGRKRFQICFYPKRGSKEHINNSTFSSLCLCISGDLSDFPIDCEWSLIGVNGSTIFGGTKRNLVLDKVRWFPLPGCPKPEEVFVTRQPEYLPRDILTIRCRIKKSRGDVLYDEFVSCRTRVESLEHSFLWPISRFSALKLNEELTIPITFGDAGVNDNFLMTFSIRGASLEAATINIVLSTVTVSNTALIAALKFRIVDKEQKVVKRVNGKICCINIGRKETFNFPDLVSRNELLENKSVWLSDDILNLLCVISTIRLNRLIETSYYGYPNAKLEFLKDSTTLLNTSAVFGSSVLSAASCETTEPDICHQRRYSLTCLADDLQSMYMDQNKTDFELKSGDVSFPVHKNILSARSPVFKAMFSSDMKESGSDSLDIPDLDSHTVNRMLTFLYTGTLDPDLQWDNAAKLYYAADKYQVQSLKQHCSCILRSDISVSNVSDILSLADRHQDTELTDFAYDLIVSHFDEIMDSKEWESFMNRDSALSGKTMHLLYKKKRQLKFPRAQKFLPYLSR